MSKQINDNLKPGLYCVSTPIGNLRDITLRALEVFRKSDYILCEDTRVSRKLLDHYDINKKIISNHKFNENKNLQQILNYLKEDKIVSIISDAGTPSISDPGRILINECIKNDIKIFPVPGVSAVTTALSISGFSDKYFFCGFLPSKQGDIIKLFKSIFNINFSIVFFISPRKFNKIIKLLEEFFIDREILICREMTKFYEEYIRTNIKSLRNLNLSAKGEATVVISEKKLLKSSLHDLDESVKKKIDKLIMKKSIKDITNKFKNEKNISKKLIYEYCLKKKNEN